MPSSCEFFATEYTHSYRKHKLKPTEIIVQKDYFEDRIEEGEIDPRIASIPTKLDKAAEQLVHKHALDNLRSVYQIHYKHPWVPRDEKEETKEKDLQSELVAYIHGLYFNPHDEKILAPPTTAKRIYGYMRPKWLHGNLSMYQDSFSRTGAMIIVQDHEKKNASKNNTIESKIKKHSLCVDLD
ncbi:unnamed protein product [Xylocopa violacea]|uniref:Uncharacterized protein n=1 Tax=Xylocopa violacea TaxID=135666 RepID=A0ABP1N644_XYLVO